MKLQTGDRVKLIYSQKRTDLSAFSRFEPIPEEIPLGSLGTVDWNVGAFIKVIWNMGRDCWMSPNDIELVE